jgi:hypothetical protein
LMSCSYSERETLSLVLFPISTLLSVIFVVPANCGSSEE